MSVFCMNPGRNARLTERGVDVVYRSDNVNASCGRQHAEDTLNLG